MDLRSRLDLGGNALLEMLVPDKELMPFGGYGAAHDLGRWWDAILRLEEATGFVIPPELEGASMRNFKLLTDNPDCMLLDNPAVEYLPRASCVIDSHNFREALLTYGGLVRRRHSAWARESGLHLVSVIDRCLNTDGSLDLKRMECWGQMPLQDGDLGGTIEGRTRTPAGWFDTTGSTGRCLEALVWFFELTGEPPVLELARRIAEHHLEFSTNPDGAMREEIIDPDNVGHLHSYLGTLRGLLLFGLLTQQKEYVDTVDATFRNAVRCGIVKESGWTSHDLGKPRFTNTYGDPVTDEAGPGDAAQIALWLALDADRVDLLDDVEKYVRARIVPAQLTDDEARAHPECDFDPRGIGTWENHMDSHGRKMGCVSDVLAAVVHSLCDIYGRICTQTQTGVKVNLHFDHEDSRLKITSTRDKQGKVSVLVKRPGSVMIRIPQWTPEVSVRLTVDGKELPLTRLGYFAWVSGDVLGDWSEVVMSYDLPERMTEEEMPSGRRYRFKWRGDEIIGIDPQDSSIPLYPALGED